MFEENPVIMMACGTQHVVALSLDSPDGKFPEIQIHKTSTQEEFTAAKSGGIEPE